ncbi:hypothetical protein CCACVL1_03703 [Corchorus capsularis]|uniref:DUF3444 domain-containing protein n=1 Tax=Corchorus capsularis TaxID=210143 RepID=A0A1R3JXS8_COCAP|nr:hypothetical protein CCACVL1_03703 [Corchorus capsularis]
MALTVLVLMSSNWPSQQQQAPGHHVANNNPFNYGTNSSNGQSTAHDGLAGHGSSNSSFQWGTFSGAAGVSGSAAPPSTSAEAASVVRKAQEKVKREREEALKAERLLKKRKEDIRVNGYVGSTATQTAMGTGPGSGMGAFDTGSIYGYSGNYSKPISERELSLFEIRNMLVDKARTVIRKKLKEWSSASEVKSAERVKEKVREKQNRKQRSANGNADEVIHKYDMVEVLDDYNEEQGVSVIPLIKVTGFRTVFRKLLDPNEVRKIPKEEMFRFSHQVPNYLLSGQEAQNAPMGCRELDPAATPLELLHVVDEASEATVEDDARKTDKEKLKSAIEGEADKLVENSSKAQGR